MSANANLPSVLFIGAAILGILDALLYGLQMARGAPPKSGHVFTIMLLTIALCVLLIGLFRWLEILKFSC